MQMSLFDFKCTVRELPLFIPNDYLFETHANKGNDRWEVYAWAIREIIAEVGGFEKSELPYRAKLQYETILGYRKEKCVVSDGSPEQEPLLTGPSEANYGVS